MTEFEDCFREPPEDNPDSDGPIDWVEKGRALKVEKMVGVEEERARVDDLDPTADAEQIARKLRGYTNEDWRDLQIAAGIGLGLPPHRRKTPSPKTQEAVIAVFEQRATAASHLEDA